MPIFSQPKDFEDVIDKRVFEEIHRLTQYDYYLHPVRHWEKIVSPPSSLSVSITLSLMDMQRCVFTQPCMLALPCHCWEVGSVRLLESFHSSRTFSHSELVDFLLPLLKWFILSLNFEVTFTTKSYLMMLFQRETSVFDISKIMHHHINITVLLISKCICCLCCWPVKLPLYLQCCISITWSSTLLFLGFLCLFSDWQYKFPHFGALKMKARKNDVPAASGNRWPKGLALEHSCQWLSG